MPDPAADRRRREYCGGAAAFGQLHGHRLQRPHHLPRLGGEHVVAGRQRQRHPHLAADERRDPRLVQRLPVHREGVEGEVVGDDARGAGVGVRADDEHRVHLPVQPRLHDVGLGVAADQDRRGVELLDQHVAEQRAAVALIHHELRRPREPRAGDRRVDLVSQLLAEALVLGRAAAV